MAFMALSDCHESVLFQNLNVLAQIAVSQFEPRFQIREICLLRFSQYGEESEARSLMDNVVQLRNVELCIIRRPIGFIFLEH